MHATRFRTGCAAEQGAEKLMNIAVFVTVRYGNRISLYRYMVKSVELDGC